MTAASTGEPATHSVAQVSATLTPLGDIEALASEWRALESDADCSFFTSWSWIGPWAAMAREQGVELHLYRRTEHGQPAALALLSRSRIKRRVIFRYDTLSLNEIPVHGLDMIIEYNGLLIRRGHEQAVYQNLAKDLLGAPPRWQEIRLSGIPEAHWQQITADLPPSLTVRIDEQRVPWATDISQVNGELDKLLAPLSRNRRWQIRRSFKAFQEEGELQTSLPNSLEEALTWFDEMGILHTARWNNVGKAGSFANVHWVDFHRQVIREGFDRGEIQLLRVSTGEKTIGYIYSFVWRGTVYMLQSGFTQEEDNVRRPGFVSHCLAMNLNSTLGNSIYDYMCGDSDYKRALAKEKNALIWGKLCKQSWRQSSEAALTRIVHRLRQLRRPSAKTATQN